MNEFLKKIKKYLIKRMPSSVLHYILYFFHGKYRRNNALFKVTNGYKFIISPFVALYFNWLLRPIYIILKKNRIIFLSNNISNSVGHVVCELDWFFRITAKNNGEIKYKYVIIWPKSEISLFASEVYGDRFHAFIVSDFLYRLILPILMRYTDITIDCGLSIVDLTLKKEKQEKNRIIQKNKFKKKKFERPFLEVWTRYASYYVLRQETFDYYPIKTNKIMSLELAKFLGGIKEKYAVIKINTNTGNATSAETDPLTYVNAIIYLQQNGYGIVFAGREEMPAVFRKLNVLNYATSSIVNFQHDIELIEASKFVLSTGSGFGFLADTMGIPMVASNSWHLTLPFPSRLCVTVPTILIDKNDNPMSFSQQIDYFYSQEQSSTLPTHSIKPRNATSSEILAAVIEAISLHARETEISELQYKFKNLKPNSPLLYSESRISQEFIEKFKYLL